MVEYDAFVSYAHGSDRIAAALQEGLQRFAKPWWRRRALRVFLDRTALSANPGLWSSIAEALDSSDWFLLVASPEAATSVWVNREVEYWLERHGTERLLVAVTGGEWIWQEELHAFATTSNAVPKTLRDAYQEEPRHVDLRWAVAEKELNLRNPRFRDQLAQLAAPIRNVSKDELEGTDLREHRRFRRTAIAVGITLALLTLASTAASIAAVSFARRATARTRDADFARLVAQSRNLSASDPSLAMLLAVEASKIRTNAQSSGALLATLSQDPRFVGNVVQKPPHSGVTSICVPDKGSVALAGGSEGTVSIIPLGNTRSSTRFRFRPSRYGPVFVSCSRNSPVAILYDNAGYWSRFDPKSGKTQGPLYRDTGLYSAAVDPSGDLVALSDTDGPGQGGHLRLQSLGVVDHSSSVLLPNSINDFGLGLAFSADGRSLATVNSKGVRVWDTSNLTSEFTIPGSPLAALSATPRTPLLRENTSIGNDAFSPDGRFLIASAGSALTLIDVNSHTVVWSEPTGWYAGSQVGFTDDGRLLVNRSAGVVQQLAVQQGDPIGNAITPHIGVAVDFAFTGSRVITASNSSSVVSLYDLDSNGPITRALPLPAPSSLLEYDPSGTSLLLSFDETLGAIFVTTRGADDKTGKLGPVLPSLIQPRFIEPHVVGGFQHTLTIGEFDSNTGELTTRPYAVSFAHATNAQFDARTHRLLLADVGGELDLYSETGAVVATPWARLGTYPVLSSSGFADNDFIAVFDSGSRQVWVLNGRGHVTLRKSTDVTMAALSPRGDRLAILHDLHVDVFDSVSGNQIGGSIGVPPGATDLEWSADGSRILAFGPDQGQLIDAVSGQPLGEPLPSSGYLALRPDGNEVASVTAGSALLWDVNSGHLEAAACQAAGRNMTQAEWTQYVPNEGSYQRVCPQWP